MKKINLFAAGLSALALVFASCGGASKGGAVEKLEGAGATFPLPYYTMAFKAYQDSVGTTVTYGGIGSGGGIRSLKDKVVDFAASDAFLSDEEAAELPAVVHVPTCMGAVVLAYNLPEVQNLNLTGEIVADIYLGKITKWNDARIAAVNEGVALPDRKITPVYRSDGSGTTFVFSDYLTKVSSSWAESVGTGKSLKWPTGIAAKGNPGVAGTVSQTQGAFGYVGSEYAFAQKIATAKLQNASGNFIEPNVKSISAAADTEIPADTRTMITNSANSEAYPISCFTWILIYKDQKYKDDRSVERATATINLIDWMLSPSAQAMTEQVHYAPLPASVVESAREQLRTVTYEGAALLK